MSSLVVVTNRIAHKWLVNFSVMLLIVHRYNCSELISYQYPLLEQTTGNIPPTTVLNWDRLPDSTVSAPSLGSFKARVADHYTTCTKQTENKPGILLQYSFHLSNITAITITNSQQI